MHGSETRPMKVEPELKMNHTEMSMIRWMCGVKLNERKKNEELLHRRWNRGEGGGGGPLTFV